MLALGRVFSCCSPDDDSVQACGCPAVGCEFVVASCQRPPLLEGIEAELDDVASHVDCLVLGDRSAASGSPALGVGLLVSAFGHRSFRSCTTAAGTSVGLQRFQQVLDHRGVSALIWVKQQDGSPLVPIHQGVDLRAPSSPGTSDGMVARLDEQILVIRQSPLCGGWC